MLVLASACNSDGKAPGAAAGPKELTRALAAIEDLPKYRNSNWGYVAVDRETGKVLASHNPDHYFDPGSTMKSYSVATALRLYGPDHRFQTPVYRSGFVNGSTLNGHLVLVASGDLSFGLREKPDGTLHFDNFPDIDHSYANIGLPGAVEPPGDPLAALNQLAGQVRASGITRVIGDVVVDDRLFDAHEFPDGLISPIWVNENLIDVRVTPGGAAGQPPSIAWRPMTAAYTVDNQTSTVAAGGQTDLKVTETAPGRLVVTGTIAAQSGPRLVVAEVADPPAFARTAFIEALRRAGVTVSAGTTGPNPVPVLPPRDSYRPADKIGEHTSATLAQFASLIMQVSYNRGADLMTCLSAVKAGSTDCEEGLAASVETVTQLGLPGTSVYPFDGAGSDDRGRSTPSALANFFREAADTPYGQALFDSLPVMGRSGTMANVLPDSPAAGKVRVKTGNRVVGTAADQFIVLGNSLAGYAETRSGRQITLAIVVGDVPLATPEEFLEVADDQARMAEMIQQRL